MALLYILFYLKYTEILGIAFHLSEGFYKSVTQARNTNKNATNTPNISTNGKHIQLQATNYPILHAQKSTAFTIFNFSKNKIHFGTVLLV